MSSLLSIIIPCYNQENFISETLESVYNQSYQNWECIIADDGSKDNSKDKIFEWVKKDQRFKYIYKENTGVSDTRNFAIHQAKGVYILPLDADDIIERDYAMEAIKVLDNDAETKLVYSDIRLFGTENRELISPKYEFINMLTENQIFCSAFYRKVDFEKTNGYNSNMKRGLEDWDFWLYFLTPESKVIKLNGYYFNYRIKEASRSQSIDHEINEELILQIFKNHIDLYLQYFNPIRDHIEAKYYKEMYNLLNNTLPNKVQRKFKSWWRK